MPTICLLASEFKDNISFIRSVYEIIGGSVLTIRNSIIQNKPFFQASLSDPGSASIIRNVLNFAKNQQIVIKIFQQEWDRCFTEISEDELDVLFWENDCDESEENNPIISLEKAVLKLNEKLARKRKVEGDSSNCLGLASEADMANILQKWQLPEIYRLFLKNYSPLNVYIKKSHFNHGLCLYGASDLIRSQAGYSYDPTTKMDLADWPADFLVIADDGADPFCIKIGDTAEVPIYTCEHGAGSWNFEVYSESFLEFLEVLS